MLAFWDFSPGQALSARLESKGINPEYSWLGERKIQFNFR